MVKKAAQLLKEADNILIISHLRPDGDTLGSAFALRHALKSAGKKTCVACDSEITPKYQIISDGKRCLKPEFKPAFVVTVDVAATKLIGESLKQFEDKIDLVIDHHPTNTNYGKLNVVDSAKASAGEIIYEILNEMRLPVTTEIANCIYIALSTDTGCFRYSNTTPESLRLAAVLYELGADATNLNRRFFETITRNQLEIQKLVFDSIKFYKNGTIGVVNVTLDMIEKTAASEDDIEGLTAFPRRVEGVLVGVVVREIGKDEYKISMRSNGLVDVSLICSKYGGGGHKRAAGCNIKGTLEEIEKQLISDITFAFEAVEK